MTIASPKNMPQRITSKEDALSWMESYLQNRCEDVKSGNEGSTSMVMDVFSDLLNGGDGLTVSSTRPAQEMIGRPLDVLGLRKVLRGEIDGEVTRYILFDAFDLVQGEYVTISTGSSMVISQIVGWEAQVVGSMPPSSDGVSGFPRRVQLKVGSSKKNPSFKPLHFAPLEYEDQQRLAHISAAVIPEVEED